MFDWGSDSSWLIPLSLEGEPVALSRDENRIGYSFLKDSLLLVLKWDSILVHKTQVWMRGKHRSLIATTVPREESVERRFVRPMDNYLLLIDKTDDKFSRILPATVTFLSWPSLNILGSQSLPAESSMVEYQDCLYFAFDNGMVLRIPVDGHINPN